MKKETPNHKPNFLLRKYANTYLQQCRIKILRGGPLDPRLQWRGENGNGNGGELGLEGRSGEEGREEKDMRL